MRAKKGELFNSIQVARPPRNTFDLTHVHATTMNFADLVPICCIEAIPGDKYDISCETFLRYQPLITPMMHQCDFTVHYFFVPNRILWPGFEDFITGNLANSAGLSQPALPFFRSTEFTNDQIESLANYLGIEPDFAAKIAASPEESVNISALPFAAYWKIYFDYYVPKELVSDDYKFYPLVSGYNSLAVGGVYRWEDLRQKGWGRDYFTSALPYAQKGNPVGLPVGTIPEARVRRVQNPGDGASFNISGVSQPGGVSGSAYAVNASGSAFAPGSLYIEAHDVGVTTINDLRRAMRLQEWLEKNARAGTRYTESNKAHFDVNSSDARLQRAEYITGVRSNIIVSEVLNTAGEEGGLPQGNMAGNGIGIANGYRDSYYCEEHGFIVGILSVTPKASYTTGIPRMFVKREDCLDWYWPEFANIGEQEIEQIELQAGSTQSLRRTFGYIPRYAEYKFINNRVSGQFADTTNSLLGPLRSWVMQRSFGTGFAIEEASLGEPFLTSDIKSVAGAPFAVEDSPIMVQQVNKIFASRLMPVFGTPTF